MAKTILLSTKLGRHLPIISDRINTQGLMTKCLKSAIENSSGGIPYMNMLHVVCCGLNIANWPCSKRVGDSVQTFSLGMNI